MTVSRTFLRSLLALTAVCMAVSCVSSPSPAPAAKAGSDESLVELARKGNVAEVQKRLANKDSVNQTDANGQTPLHIAAAQGNVELLELLIAMKADTELRDTSGATPLAAASSAGMRESARVLSAAGANIFAENNSGVSVYRLARAMGSDAFTAILSPATVAQRDANGKTALHHACADLDGEAVDAILKVGGETSLADNRGDTPLSLAYAAPEKDASAIIASRLLLAGAEPLRGDFSYFETAVLKRNPSMRFEEGKTPLHIAASAGHSGYVTYMLAHGAQVNAKDIASATALHEAVRGGHARIVSAITVAGADANLQDSSGNTPLHLVMPEASRSEIFGILLRARSNPNKKDNYGETPLHIAARLGMSEDIVRELVAAGADVNERNKKGITPLSLAIERRQIAQARLFVTIGADIHAEDIDDQTALSRAIKAGIELVEAIVTVETAQTRDSRGRTPLHVAVSLRADPAITKYVISKKADVNARDKNGDTPLHIAVRANDRANGEALLVAGADVFSANVTGESALRAALTRMGGRQDWVLNSRVISSSDGAGNTPLHLAAEWQLTPVVSFIVDKGGDLGARNANGETPLFNAVKSDSGETIRSMLSGDKNRKADANARDYLGNTALHACIRWSAANAADALLAHDAQSNGRRLVSARNLAGKTALHEAARSGNVSFIRTLIAAGADINAVDETGKTSLTDAIQANRAEAIRSLLDRGASPVMQDMYGRNAFHEAVECASADTVKLIRSAGGNPMARDTWGKTPLSLALRKSPETVMAVLGTNANVVDSDGNTPLHAAVAERAGPEVLKALLQAKFPVNNRNRTGSTALLVAVRNGDEAATRALLSAGGDPFAADNSGASALSIALTSSQALLPALVETAADRTDTIGDGILHYASRLADEKTVARLLTLPRIDRAARNVAGETAYDIAIRWQRPGIAELLK